MDKASEKHPWEKKVEKVFFRGFTTGPDYDYHEQIKKCYHAGGGFMAYENWFLPPKNHFFPKPKFRPKMVIEVSGCSDDYR